MLSLAAMRAWRLARVTMLIQYLYRDEVALGRFQTGLVFANNRRSRRCRDSSCRSRRCGESAFETVLWGQIRGGRPGRKLYQLEVLHRNDWKPVGHARLTNNEVSFIRTIRLKHGALLRIWSPRQRRLSLQLRVR